MNRSRLNLFLDVVSFLVFLALIETGLMMKFVLPPGSGGRGGGRAMSVWGWSRHDWGDVHFWLSVSLVALMLVHVALHWRWVCSVTCQLLGRRPSTDGETSPGTGGTICGLGALLCIVFVTGGLFWWSWQNATMQDGVGGGEHGRGWRGGHGAASGSDQPQEASFGRQVSTRSGEGTPSQVSAARPSAPTRPDSTANAAGRKEPSPTGGHATGEESQVRGNMTLEEVERATGVSAARILRELGLPADTPTNERLGRLRRTHGFEIERVRAIVEEARLAEPPHAPSSRPGRSAGSTAPHSSSVAPVPTPH